MNVGGRIRDARQAAGLTQNQLAQRVGVSDQGTVSRWEAGRREPSLDQLRKIGAAVGQHPGWFFEAPDA